MAANSEECQKLKRSRTAMKSSFTKKHKALEELLNLQVLDTSQLLSDLSQLETRLKSINDIDGQIYDLLVNDLNTDEAVLEEEIDSSSDYQNKFNLIKIKIDKLFDTDKSQQSQTARGTINIDRQMKLPKIKLRQFNGDLLSWLPFWSQFQQIDEDERISKVDKFHYLLQSMVDNSKAYQIVSSFPPTNENYDKALASLKARFGNKDLLVEVYVRELLKLTLTNIEERGSLTDLYDKLNSQIRALDSLGVTSETCSAMLFPLVESSLPEELLRVWQRTSLGEGDTSIKRRLERLMGFLKQEVENEERIALAVGSFSKVTIEKSVHTAAGLVNNAQKTREPIKIVCIFCKEKEPKHSPEKCPAAVKMSYQQKKTLLLKKGCCFICFRRKHKSKDCRMKLQCSNCKRRHFEVMCQSNHKTTENKNTPPECSLTNNTVATVFLQTLAVKVRGELGEYRVRAMIDTGSQRSYVQQSVAKEMGYKSLGTEELIHCLFGGSHSEKLKHNAYKIRLAKLDNSYSCNFTALDQDIITNSVPCIQKGPWFGELSKLGIDIADTVEGPILVLIGADIAGKIMTGRKHILSSGLVAIETVLGWTLIGKSCENVNVVDTRISNDITCSNLTTPISDLWSLDVLGIRDPGEKKTREEIEKRVQRHFDETVSFKKGRYEVHLPWIEDHPALPSNRELAFQRTRNLVVRLKREGYFEMYNKVLEEWLEEGVIEYASNLNKESPQHYLPHRHVIKLSSKTSPVRPVFDASAKSKDTPSLNDCLEKGPNLIERIPQLILRFRLNKIGVVSDIRRAFLQISLFENDRDFFRFFWVDEKGETVILRHTRVVFGAVCSPYHLGAVIFKHLEKIKKRVLNGTASYKLDIINNLVNSFYMDNCVTSVRDDVELKNFVREASEIMAEAGMDLRGWEHTDKEAREERTGVLGLQWNKKEDSLLIATAQNSWPKLDENKITKRLILSIAQKLFDPIGFCAPITITPKLIIQEMWTSKIGWDDPVPPEISKRFMSWYSELWSLKELSIPRFILGTSSCEMSYSVHIFTDASAQAYASVIFLRGSSKSGTFLKFIQAKNRVAPISGITIPRLELLAATIGARLYSSIESELEILKLKKYFWTDSTTTLAWIQREDNWGVYVRNRVSEIRKLTSPSDWRHIPGKFNAADLPSRGCSVKSLLKNKWEEGPSWLLEPEENWPIESNDVNEDEVREEKLKGIVSCVNKSETRFSDSLKYFSKYSRIIRVIAYCTRFLNNCRKPQQKVLENLSNLELEDAETKLLIIIQKESFSGVTDKKLKLLYPIIDMTGVIRIRTKLENKIDDLNFRFPAVLPAKNDIVNKLIFENHLRNSHIEGSTLLSVLREKFWILGGRRTVKTAVRQCSICKRFSSKALKTPPIALPNNRVRDAYAFEIVGVDFAGPLYLKNNEKSYICLFTCAVYRAVHLELVCSLSTIAFLQALRRFINRRGRPNTIYSDDGTNFVGTDNAFKKLNWSEIQNFSSERQIKWVFSAPAAPWWGGWWERMVGLTKSLLRKNLGRALLTYEELSTVLTDCEDMINSRPLTYVPNDKPDLEPLTPKKFIQDLQSNGTADIDVIDAKSLDRRTRYRQTISDGLKQRFRTEYLGQLKLLHKRQEERKIKIGDVVLIGTENTKRLDWPLAVIEEMLPGQDGQVRLVRLRTATGHVLRPVQKIYPLELNNSAQEEN